MAGSVSLGATSVTINDKSSSNCWSGRIIGFASCCPARLVSSAQDNITNPERLATVSNFIINSSHFLNVT